MKIAIRGGHNPGVPGAHGILDEVAEDRKYYKSVMNHLLAMGHAVLDVTPGSTSTSAEDLTYGVKKANDWGADLFVSCHVNAFTGVAKGAEVLHHANSTKGREYAVKVCDAICALGFSQRGSGAKADIRGLYEINHTDMPAIIVEPFFLDNVDDVALYKRIGYDAIGIAIAKAINGDNIVVAETPKVPQAPSVAPEVNELVVRLQRNLNRLWFTDDSAQTIEEDGIMGPRTKQATKKFQKVVALSVDGIAGANTWSALNVILSKPLCKHDKFNRTATRYIQWRLDANPDGIYGTNTIGHVKSYQIDMGLEPDGICWTGYMAQINRIRRKTHEYNIS